MTEFTKGRESPSPERITPVRTYTPAPWKMDKEELKTSVTEGIKYLYCISSESEERGWIADVVDTCNGRTEANARLIAAAPELLEALKAIMQRAVKDAEKYAPEGNEPIWAFISDASDAIQKAEG